MFKRFYFYFCLFVRVSRVGALVGIGNGTDWIHIGIHFASIFNLNAPLVIRYDLIYRFFVLQFRLEITIYVKVGRWVVGSKVACRSFIFRQNIWCYLKLVNWTSFHPGLESQGSRIETNNQQPTDNQQPTVDSESTPWIVFLYTNPSI